MAYSAKRQQGFTLIEVIIASALLCIMACPVFGCISFCASSSARSKVNVSAASASQSLMEYFKGLGYDGMADMIDGSGGDSCTVYYFLTDDDIPAISNVAAERKISVGGCDRGGLDEAAAAMPSFEVDCRYIAKVCIARENGGDGSREPETDAGGKAVYIDLLLRCTAGRYSKDIEMVSIEGE